MTAAALRPFVAKEIRALLPAWLASACAIGAAVLNGPRSHDLGLIAYGFASVILGAQSIGHEYTHRTLMLLLTQPRSRRQILLLKLAVLIPLLLALTAFAWLTLLQPGEWPWVFASLLNAICLAPLLTMASRNPLAAVVFTGAAPVWLLVLTRYVGGRTVWGSMFAVSVIAAVGSWRMFMRLEAIDGRGAEMRLPPIVRRWIAATFAASTERRRTRHPVWLLVNKEFHLQQMTFAVACVWLLIWTVESLLTLMVPGFKGLPLPLVSILFGALLALLIGSLAGAEERQLGTLEWQALLPMAAWRQWTVKVATAFGLAAVLALGLPILLAGGHVGVSAWHVGVIVFLTAGSLYVSSLCRTTLRALIVSGPLMLALGMVLLRLGSPWGLPNALIAVPTALIVVLMLWFAFENHRLAGHSAARVMRQAMWIAGGLGVGAAVVGLL
jgi:hypothetical protein